MKKFCEKNGIVVIHYNSVKWFVFGIFALIFLGFVLVSILSSKILPQEFFIIFPALAIFFFFLFYPIKITIRKTKSTLFVQKRGSFFVLRTYQIPLNEHPVLVGKKRRIWLIGLSKGLCPVIEYNGSSLNLAPFIFYYRMVCMTGMHFQVINPYPSKEEILALGAALGLKVKWE